jgi:hypothetical protein
VGIFGNLRFFSGDVFGVIGGVFVGDSVGASIQSESHSQHLLHLQVMWSLKNALARQLNKYFKDIYLIMILKSESLFVG